MIQSMNTNVSDHAANPSAKLPAFVIAQTQRVQQTRAVPRDAPLGCLPNGARWMGTVLSHTALLSRNMGGFRHILRHGNLAGFRDPVPAHTWPGFMVAPIQLPANPASTDDPSPGREISHDQLDSVSSVFGQTVDRAWISDAHNLLSIAYFHSSNPRLFGNLIADHLLCRPHDTELGSGLRLENDPSEPTPLCLYFHTASSWKRSQAHITTDPDTLRTTYARWRFESLSISQILRTCLGIPHQVVKASPHPQRRSLGVPTLTQPWAVDQRPCSISVERARTLRVVAYRFGTDATLFHRAYLLDGSGREHLYAAYYCLLRESEPALIRHLALLAETHQLEFETFSEESAAPFS